MSVKSILMNPLTFPLHGPRLIEASAGTGKTYTISSLYIRLLLNHGDLITRFGRPLAVNEILLVTFTEAATQELKARIRDRIAHARQAFLCGKVNGDKFLGSLLKDIPEETYPQCVLRLDTAHRQMDEAAIFTIHGFCHRMLKQSAFESGMLFDVKLLESQNELIEKAVQDYWRESVYGLSSDQVLKITHKWKGPEAFLKEISPFIEREGLEIQPSLPQKNAEQRIAALINERYKLWHQLVFEFKKAWQIARSDLQTIIQHSDINKRSYSNKNLPNWFAEVDLFCADEACLELPTSLEKFSQANLLDKTKGTQAPLHPIFEQAEAVLKEEPAITGWFKHAGILRVRERVDQLKAQQQALGFNDLLKELEKAIVSDREEELANRLRGLFPVAMIDEFQDTDLTQYTIFNRIYFHAPGSGIFLIGDPKQAIYSFRNADIFTYIGAKQAVKEHYHLDTNWRSTKAMINAVNTVFTLNQSAFIYKEAIPFLPVEGGDKADNHPLNTEGNEYALQFLHLRGEAPFKKKEAQYYLANYCADEVANLLNQGAQGSAKISNQAVSSADIAVLVRDKNEADLVMSCLYKRNIDSVYLSLKDSVFSSQEAYDIYLLMLAVTGSNMNTHWVADEKAIRNALASYMFHYKQHELESMFFCEEEWEQTLAEFLVYHQTWKTMGLLPMLHQVLHQRQLLNHIINFPNAERRLTNILHIAELLHQAEASFSSEKELLRWLYREMFATEHTAEENLLRLDSDRQRVRVITIHKSKGLEYPIVFIPFACSYRSANVALYQDDARLCKVLDLEASKKAKQLAEKERLAEDLRLLYVALTRSIYRCYLGVADVVEGNGKNSALKKSALGYLLLDDKESDLEISLSLLSTDSKDILVRSFEAENKKPIVFSGDLAQQVQDIQVRQLPKTSKENIERNWRVSSFSALTRSTGASIAAHRSLASEWGLDVLQESDLSRQTMSEQKDIFTFPKGAKAGILMHSLFEEIDFTRIEDEKLKALVQEKLLLAGYEVDWFPVLTAMVKEVVQSSLVVFGTERNNGISAPNDALRLALISANKRLVELEFTLPAKILKNDILQRHERALHPGQETPDLLFPLQRGYLKGFIDLVFEWQGKYYILDYKSNFLGDALEDYQPEKLCEVVSAHHYGLQYLIYSLAVHRYLKQRVSDYQYDHHFGGVYYLFLRGVRKMLPGNGIYFKKPAREIIESLDASIAGEAYGE